RNITVEGGQRNRHTPRGIRLHRNERRMGQVVSHRPASSSGCKTASPYSWHEAFNCRNRRGVRTRSTEPPVRAVYLASVGGGGPVNFVLVGVEQSKRPNYGSIPMPLLGSAAMLLSF